jgi:hypothetical protein
MRAIGFLIAGLALVAAPVASHAADAAAKTSSPVKVQVPAAVRSMADNPKPPAGATKKTNIGKGKTAVDTSNGPGDEDSFWVEKIDVDGDGDVEATDVVWDDEDRVLYLYNENDSLVCAGGGDATADMLVAINGKGNARKRPAGSGWYIVSLDEGECSAEAAEAYGCRFDAQGNPTACGVAVVDAKNDDIVFATVSESD